MDDIDAPDGWETDDGLGCARGLLFAVPFALLCFFVMAKVLLWLM